MIKLFLVEDSMTFELDKYLKLQHYQEIHLDTVIIVAV